MTILKNLKIYDRLTKSHDLPERVFFMAFYLRSGRHEDDEMPLELHRALYLSFCFKNLFRDYPARFGRNSGVLRGEVFPPAFLKGFNGI
jgi:hypothetical protein